MQKYSIEEIRNYLISRQIFIDLDESLIEAANLDRINLKVMSAVVTWTTIQNEDLPYDGNGVEGDSHNQYEWYLRDGKYHCNGANRIVNPVTVKSDIAEWALENEWDYGSGDSPTMVVQDGESDGVVTIYTPKAQDRFNEICDAVDDIVFPISNKESSVLDELFNEVISPQNEVITYYLIGDADAMSTYVDDFDKLNNALIEETGISWTIANSNEDLEDIMESVASYGHYCKITKAEYEILLEKLN